MSVLKMETKFGNEWNYVIVSKMGNKVLNLCAEWYFSTTDFRNSKNNSRYHNYI